MQVIGVAAQLANGKDVLCDYLVKQLNYKHDLTNARNRRVVQEDRRWQRSAFANAVKEVYEQSFGVDRAFIEEWKRNPDPPPGMQMNVRKGLQFIGDGFRQIRYDIWIDIALRDESKKLIISDSRYINEAEAIKKKDGMMILLYRPGFLNDDPNPSEAQIKPLVEFCAKHVEEGPIHHGEVKGKALLGSIPALPPGLDFYDYFIKNDSTIEDFYAKIDEQLIPFIKSKYEV